MDFKTFCKTPSKDIKTETGEETEATDNKTETGDESNGSENTELLAGGRVSAVGRGGNGIWKPGANTEIIRGSLGDAQSATGISNGNVAAGESGGISSRGFPFARTVGTGLDKNFLGSIQGVKISGRDNADFFAVV